ncbi:MAG: heme exporter protein CcmB, partial [Gammaproteobacteria bacterium]
MHVFSTIYKRDLSLHFRKWPELVNPLIFFAVVTTLFPLAMSPDARILQPLGIGVAWVAAFLASLLALDGLFRNDVDDGSMEQLLLSPAPLGITVLAKIAAHWSASALPLVIVVPLAALSFRLPGTVLPTLSGALLLATPALSVFVALGAALTVSLKTGGSIIGLLVLPLCAPLLIFGARATDLALGGEPVAAPLYFLGAISVLAISL